MNKAEMIERQDRQGARTPAGLDEKYGKLFKELENQLGSLSSEYDERFGALPDSLKKLSESFEKDLSAVRDQIKNLSDKSEPVIPTFSDIFNRVYPVGSFYFSAKSANPGSLFGGSWERVKDRFLLASGDAFAVGSVGGEAYHTLTQDELPLLEGIVGPLDDYSKTNLSGVFSNGGAVSYDASSSGSGGGWKLKFSVGGDRPHNNMPPYLAVYVWQRIS